jgi:acetyltransferase-like isoleucine patch superfamily enzyme
VPFRWACRARARLYRPFFRRVGADFSLCDGTTIENLEEIEIGDRVSINQACYVCGYGGLVIGNDVMIANGCVLMPPNHNVGDLSVPMRDQGVTARPIVIEDDVWIGANAVILGGVRIGRGAVVGAGAVLRRDLPPYALALGNPATILRNWRRAGAPGGAEPAAAGAAAPPGGTAWTRES